MPKKLEKCVSKVKKQGKPKDQAYAICSASTGIKRGKGGKWVKESTDIVNLIQQIHNKEYANAKSALETIVNNKIKDRIREVKSNLEENNINESAIKTYHIGSLDGTFATYFPEDNQNDPYILPLTSSGDVDENRNTISLRKQPDLLKRGVIIKGGGRIPLKDLVKRGYSFNFKFIDTI